MKEKESGITLLSLVVTIIVMLILAGIALRLSIGDNGIIGRTGNTIDLYQNASDQEGQGLNTFVDEFNQILNEDRPGGEDNTGDNITIADRPTISIIDWDNKGGIVQVSTQAGYTTQYRIGRTGPWKTYDGTAVNVDNGDTIYARYANDEGVSQTVGQIVEDTNGPEVTIIDTVLNGKIITVTATASDNEMGMPEPPTYNYYIKEHTENYYESVGHNTTGEYDFSNLKAYTLYDFRVSTTDLAGNQGSATTTGKTGSLVDMPTLVVGENLLFELDPAGPTNGNVNVSISAPNLDEHLYIEYSINGTDNWQKYEGPIEMTDNGRVYARVTDTVANSNEVYADVTNIDREKPVASATPETDTNKVKQRDVTVTIVEYGSAGFNKDQSLHYAWTQSNTEAPKDLQTISGTNDDKANNISFKVNGKDITGTYYLYVQGIQDKAKNTSDEKFFGPYYFDNEVPKVEFGPSESTEYNKHYDITLTYPDGDEDEITNIEYEWVKGEDTKPDFDNNGTEINPGDKIPSPDDATGDDYYLWIKIEDEFGNVDEIKAGPYYIDNAGPDITFEEGDYTTPKQSHTVQVNVADPNSGLKEDMPKYVWINGDSVPTEDTLKNGTTFSSGEEISSPSGETGDNWHLWIYAEDVLGNTSKKDIGPFNLDNTVPTATFNPDGNTSSWNKNYTVSVNPTDANSDVNGSKLKYQWTQGKNKPDTILTTGTTFTQGSSIPSPSGVTGNDWYLWVYVEDNAGNSNIIGTTNPFYIDNTAPTLQLTSVPVSPVIASNTIKIEANASDAHSGVNNSSYKYYIKEKGGQFTEAKNISIEGKQITFTNLKAGIEYTIRVEVKDNAQNTTTKDITIITGSVAAGESVIEYEINPNDWTNQNVHLSLNIAQGYEGYKIQYKLPGNDWKEYENAIEISSNQTVQVRPLDASDNIGGEMSIDISKIDKVAPTLSAEPSTDKTASQTKKIVVTAQDSNNDNNISGFLAGRTIKYAWSTSSTEAPSFDLTASSTNTLGSTKATFEVTTPNYTGNYYLWIQAGCIADRAGNTNAVAHFGPYTLDNQAPSITFTPNGDNNYTKVHNVAVNSGDATVRRYVWQQQNTKEPAKGDFTGAFTNDETLTKNSGSGDWYLWVYVEDSLGNSAIKCSNVFKFDNTAPTITFGTNGNSTPQKTHSTTVNIANDGYSSIDNNTLKYIWSTSATGITESSFNSVSDTYTNGENVQNSTLNGNYYLWVIAKDTAGNTTIKRTDNTFNFDNTIPKVTFTPTQNTKPAKSQTVKVSVTDTNLNANSLKYVWTTTNSKPAASSITTSFTNNGNITINTGSGNRYLWILAYDTPGNELIAGAGPYLVDNTPPTVSLTHTGTTNSITVNVSATDDYSGIASYSYTIKQVGGSYTQTVTDGQSHTFGNLPSSTAYTITVTVTDGSGNATTKTTEQINTGTVPGGTTAINISQQPQSWTNAPVTVTITNNSGNTKDYHIVYKIGSNGKETQYSTPFQVSQNAIIYAWLEDSIGNAGAQASADISNIDTQKPNITAQPNVDETPSQNKQVKITATDVNYDSNIAGFKANQSLKYAWSTSSTTAPSSYTTLTGTNTAGTKTLNFNVSLGNYTGTYYLWIQAGSLTDQAGNTSNAMKYGPYVLINEVPKITFSPNGSTTYQKHYDITLTYPDGNQDEITNLKYQWVKGSSTQPDLDNNGTKISTGDKIPSPDNVTGNDYYLWLKVEDKYGNSDEIKVGPYYLDNEGPKITYTQGDYTTAKKSHTVTVNASDSNSGMQTGMPKYVWINGDSTPTNDTLKNGTTFTSGSAINTPAGATGNNYHLWIYAEDKLGNYTTQNIGPFNLDNTAPTVTFNPNGNTKSWSKSYSVTVNVTDNNSNVNTSKLKYQWTQSKTKPDTITTAGRAFTNGGAIASPSGVTGNNWYLWVYVEDNAGNSNTIGTTNPFYIDNTAPSLSLSLESLSTTVASNTIGIIATASDSQSGVNGSSYTYYIKKGTGSYGNAVKDGSTHRFTGLTAKTQYTIKVEVTDNVGNKTSKELTVTTGSVAQGATVLSYNLNPNSWTKGNVVLTLSLNSGYSGYSIEYKDGASGTWQSYTIGGSGITVTTNKTIYARPKDSAGNAGSEIIINITNIDRGAPTLSAQPSSESTASQTKTITVTATDTNFDSNISGFTAGKTIKYGWTTSSTTAPTYNLTAISTNTAGAKTATFSITTPKYTGNYYLWIQGGSISDRAGNSNAVAHFGPYTLDNQAPSITFSPNGNSTYAKSQSVTVNAGDATVRKYVWTQSTSQPANSAFTGTFTNGGTITKNSGSGDWYLWIYVEDSLGNSSYKCSGVFKLDNTAPTITFGTNGNTTPKKVQSTTVNIADDGYSSINTSSLKYLWSTSSSGITESSFGSASTYTNGGSVSNSTLNGNYYLWVIAKDSAGNTTIKKTDNVFNFDNTIPTVTFTPNKNTTAAKSQTVKVSVSDTNLNASSLKYVWTTTNSKPAASSITTSFTNNGNITISSGSGNRYLWILAYDTAINELISGAGPYLVDNTPPTVSLSHTGTTSSIKVTTTATDVHSGIASYSYTINQVGGTYTATATDGASHTFSGLKQGSKYTVTVTVKDGAGNTTTKTTEQITTASIPAGTAAIDISLSPTSWTKGPVTVTITNSQSASNLHIEYRVGTSGSYATYSKAFTVSQNTTIYAKIVDDAGNEGSVATANIAYIDNKAPTISASPASDSTYAKTKSVKITATDTNYDSNIAGFKVNQSLKYAWSTSSTTAPTSFSTLTGTNTAGTKSISYTVSGSSYTGTYYLWIQAGCLSDQAGNTSAVTHFGPYYFDNTVPTLNGSITATSTSKSISVTVPGIKDGQGTVSSPKYIYYIKKSSATTYTQDGSETSSTTHTFNNLDDNTTYNIKVTFKDNAGNVGQATVNKQTVLVPTLNSSNTTFKLSNTKWTNKPITVTISTTVSGYTLQYSTNGSSYQKYTGPITVSSNLTVYARLWDERNTTENVGTATSKAITNVDPNLSDLGVIVKNGDPVPEDTPTTDKNKNPITIPKGFTPEQDPNSGDPYEPTVDNGVVVKDGSGNEFVWIPVGTINTSSGTKTINYNRYVYSGWVNGGTDSDTNSMKIKTSSSSSEYFAESLNESEKTSAVNNHGFYLGRYEAGVSSGVRTESSGTSAKVEIKQGKDVYNYVTQSEARTLAENMATVEGYSGTTNLPSSYAWDTALKFLEQTGNSSYLTNSSQGNYYNTQYGGKTQANASALIETGRTTAVKHLYDMGGNVYEWTTERYSNSEATKVSRGGFYGFLSTDEPVIGRFSSSNTADQAVGFRVAMFLGTVNKKAPEYIDELQVGDYVAYTPGNETASSYSLTAAESGYTSDQTLTRDTLNWRVLSINDDGTVDLISATPTTQTIYFRGATGYNNGVYLLNDIADQLYSNDSLGVTARSLTIEDIEAGMTDAGLEYVHSYNNGYKTVGETATYTRAGYRYYPNLYAQENGSGIDTDTIKEDGINQSDSYYSEPTTEFYTQANSSLTVTQKYYYRSMSSSYYKNSTFYNLVHSGNTYWLASRYVDTNSNIASFGLRGVNNSYLYGSNLFYSYSSTYSSINRLRAVVSLKSNIKLGSGDGKSSSTAYQIIN